MSATTLLTPTQLDRFEKTLRSHRTALQALLQHPERDPNDLHLQLASSLRFVLVDLADGRPKPVLQTVADHKGIDVRVWGPWPHDRPVPPGDEPGFMASALIASHEPVPFLGHEMSLEQYMVTIIGATTRPDGKGGWKNTTWTPTQLIKWVANKDGGSHLETNPMATLEVVKSSFQIMGTVEGYGSTEGFPVRQGIVQLAQFAVHAIDQVLKAP